MGGREKREREIESEFREIKGFISATAKFLRECDCLSLSLSLSHSLDAARERRIRDVRVRLDPYVMFGTYMYKYAGAREISNFTSPKVVRASLSSSRAPDLMLCVLSFSMLILLQLTFLIHIQHVYDSIWTLYTRRVRILCVFRGKSNISDSVRRELTLLLRWKSEIFHIFRQCGNAI